MLTYKRGESSGSAMVKMYKDSTDRFSQAVVYVILYTSYHEKLKTQLILKTVQGYLHLQTQQRTALFTSSLRE